MPFATDLIGDALRQAVVEHRGTVPHGVLTRTEKKKRAEEKLARASPQQIARARRRLQERLGSQQSNVPSTQESISATPDELNRSIKRRKRNRETGNDFPPASELDSDAYSLSVAPLSEHHASLIDEPARYSNVRSSQETHDSTLETQDVPRRLFADCAIADRTDFVPASIEATTKACSAEWNSRLIAWVTRQSLDADQISDLLHAKDLSIDESTPSLGEADLQSLQILVPPCKTPLRIRKSLRKIALKFMKTEMLSKQEFVDCLNNPSQDDLELFWNDVKESPALEDAFENEIHEGIQEIYEARWQRQMSRAAASGLHSDETPDTERQPISNDAMIQENSSRNYGPTNDVSTLLINSQASSSSPDRSEGMVETELSEYDWIRDNGNPVDKVQANFDEQNRDSAFVADSSVESCSRHGTMVTGEDSLPALTLLEDEEQISLPSSLHESEETENTTVEQRQSDHRNHDREVLDQVAETDDAGPKGKADLEDCGPETNHDNVTKTSAEISPAQVKPSFDLTKTSSERPNLLDRKPEASKYRSGRLSQHEKAAVLKAVKNLMHEQGLSQTEFCAAIHDNSRQGKKWLWSSLIYCIPERNPKNMREYIKKAYRSDEHKSARFSTQEKEELIRLVKRHGRHWRRIGEMMDRYREDCQQTYRRIEESQETKRTDGPWSDIEQKAFDAAMAAFQSTQKVDFREVADSVGTRTPRQCLDHARIRIRTDSSYKNNSGSPISKSRRKSSTNSSLRLPHKQKVVESTPPTDQVMDHNDLEKLVVYLLQIKLESLDEFDLPSDLGDFEVFGYDQLQSQITTLRKKVKNWRTLSVEETLHQIKEYLQHHRPAMTPSQEI